MMKSMAFALATTAFAAQTETDNFEVTVSGSSGTIRVSPKGDATGKKGITIKQDKVEFTEGGSSVGGGFNVAGGSWTEFAEVDKVLTSTFTSEDNQGQKFSIKVEIASETTEATGPTIDCTGCSDETTGVCKNAAGVCADKVDNEGTLSCPADYTECFSTYFVRADAVEFTPTFENFNFQNVNQGLSYSIEVTAPEKDDGESEEIASAAVEQGDEYSLSVGPGSVSSVTSVQVQETAGAAAKSVDIPLPGVETKNGRTTLTWNFPKEAQGAKITFDPSISLSPASWVAPTLLTSLGVAFVALF